MLPVEAVEHLPPEEFEEVPDHEDAEQRESDVPDLYVDCGSGTGAVDPEDVVLPSLGPSEGLVPHERLFGPAWHVVGWIDDHIIIIIVILVFLLALSHLISTGRVIIVIIHIFYSIVVRKQPQLLKVVTFKIVIVYTVHFSFLLTIIYKLR